MPKPRERALSPRQLAAQQREEEIRKALVACFRRGRDRPQLDPSRRSRPCCRRQEGDRRPQAGNGMAIRGRYHLPVHGAAPGRPRRAPAQGNLRAPSRVAGPGIPAVSPAARSAPESSRMTVHRNPPPPPSNPRRRHAARRGAVGRPGRVGQLFSAGDTVRVAREAGRADRGSAAGPPDRGDGPRDATPVPTPSPTPVRPTAPDAQGSATPRSPRAPHCRRPRLSRRPSGRRST